MTAAIAVAALAVALGATDDEADAVWALLQSKPLPHYPTHAIMQVRAALITVRAEA